MSGLEEVDHLCSEKEAWEPAREYLSREQKFLIPKSPLSTVVMECTKKAEIT
jgi:hypothetical protein